jgi:hypothetical protein
MDRRLVKNHLLRRGDVRQEQLEHADFANNSLHMCVSKLRTSAVSNELICLRRNVTGPKSTMHAVKERLISHDMD